MTQENLKPCPNCNGTGTVKIHYELLFDDLVTQTPKSVWDGYLESGYALREAIKEERSYA